MKFNKPYSNLQPIMLYNPFFKNDFNFNVCFLTGNSLGNTKRSIQVFPEWIMERYSLHNQSFMMLAENKVNYDFLILPVSETVYDVISALDDRIKSAFSSGYAEVIKLTEKEIFQWLAIRVYGILYNDISYAHMQLEDLQLSDYYLKSIKTINFLLQSLVIPFEFKKTPWSITIQKVKYSKDIFNYKDETKKLSVSLAMHDFGIIACLQDGGCIAEIERKLTSKLSGLVLHPIQFEELWCRFIYSNYLLAAQNFTFTEGDGKIIFDNKQDCKFEDWDDKIFSQVLANYWKPWGFTVDEIYQHPASNISYLADEITGEIVEPESITLPW